jgi:hypothetical protein
MESERYGEMERVMIIFGGEDIDSKRLTKKIAEGGICSVRMKMSEDKCPKRRFSDLITI